MKSLRRYYQSHDFRVREPGYDVSLRYIAEMIYTISGKFPAHIVHSMDICDEVAHIIMMALRDLYIIKMIKINDMWNLFVM